MLTNGLFCVQISKNINLNGNISYPIFVHGFIRFTTIISSRLFGGFWATICSRFLRKPQDRAQQRRLWKLASKGSAFLFVVITDSIFFPYLVSVPKWVYFTYCIKASQDWLLASHFLNVVFCMGMPC